MKSVFELRREKLARALLSSRYKRTTERLRKDNRFCPMGMACEVFRKETGRGYWDGHFFMLNNTKYGTNAPEVVVDWFGFDLTDVHMIINLNDGEEWSSPTFSHKDKPVAISTIVRFIREFV